MNNPFFFLSDFSLPEINSLKFSLPCDALLGFTYAKTFQVNPVLMVTILSVRNIAHVSFYLLATHLLKKDLDNQKIFTSYLLSAHHSKKDLDQYKIFAITSTVTNTIFLFALKEFRLISQLSFIVLSLSFIGYLSKIISHIQIKEDCNVNHK